MKTLKKFFPILVFLALLLLMALFPYIPLLILGIKVGELSQSTKIWYNFFCDIVFMFLVFMAYKDNMIRDIKNYFKNFSNNLELSFKYYFAGLGIMVVSNIIISLLFKSASANNEQTVRELLGMYPLYMIFSISIYAPFIEETIFRKSIKDAVLAWGDNKVTKYIYIITSGLIFSLMHIIGMTSSLLDYLYIIPYMSLGCVFAALYHRTDNLFNSISMHFMHNTVAIILYFLLGIA